MFGLQQSQPLNLFSWDGHFEINTCKLAIAVKNDIRNLKKVVLPDALLHQDLHLLLHLPQLLLKLEQLSLPLVLRIVILTVSRTGVVFHETS